MSDTVRQLGPTEIALILGNRDKYMGRARQCHRRSHPTSHECKTAEAQQRNADRRNLYLEVLMLLGYGAKIYTGETIADNDIVFQRTGDPQIDDIAVARMQTILTALGETDAEHPVTVATRRLEEAVPA